MLPIFSFAYLCSFQNIIHDRLQNQLPYFVPDVFLQFLQGLGFVNIDSFFKISPQEKVGASQVWGMWWPIDISIARDNVVTKALPDFGKTISQLAYVVQCYTYP